MCGRHQHPVAGHRPDTWHLGADQGRSYPSRSADDPCTVSTNTERAGGHRTDGDSDRCCDARRWTNCEWAYLVFCQSWSAGQLVPAVLSSTAGIDWSWEGMGGEGRGGRGWRQFSSAAPQRASQSHNLPGICPTSDCLLPPPSSWFPQTNRWDSPR